MKMIVKVVRYEEGLKVMTTVFNIDNKNNLESKLFLDENGGVGIARYDKVKYKKLDDMTEKQLSFFWRPQEVDLQRDVQDFRKLTNHEQHIFTSNLKRQILLDSVQGRAPTITFLPVCSLPELEVWIQTWAFSETIHSKSYTHIIRNVYSDPSKIFDEILDIKEIVDCSKDISKYYDELLRYNMLKESNSSEYNQYEHKKAIYLALCAVYSLEAVRFYVSFACSWAFGELKKMEGNAKIIKLIARDENLHLGAVQQILKFLPKDDEDFVKLEKECNEEVIKIFMDVINQEKEWANYLFKDSSMLGLNKEILCDYVDWIAHKRMKIIGLKPPFIPPQENPLPWTNKWISGAEVQVAPQETEITSYVIGQVDMNVSEDDFKDFSL